MLRHVRLFVCPSVRMERRLGYRWVNFHEINIWGVIKDMSREFMFQQNLTRIMATLYNGLCAFMIASRCILLRKRNVSDKSCSKKQKFYVQHLFPENRAVYEIM